MCCHHRRRNASCNNTTRRRYRGPLIVVLGKMAYDKYQERKALKAIAAGEAEQSSAMMNEKNNLPGSATVIRGKGSSVVELPEYQDVVGNAPEYTGEEKGEKEGWVEVEKVADGFEYGRRAVGV